MHTSELKKERRYLVRIYTFQDRSHYEDYGTKLPELEEIDFGENGHAIQRYYQDVIISDGEVFKAELTPIDEMEYHHPSAEFKSAKDLPTNAKYYVEIKVNGGGIYQAFLCNDDPSCYKIVGKD